MVKVVKRRRMKRIIRHLVAGESCRVSIGELYRGMEVFGLTNGQFSFINVIEHILSKTGPANVDVSTWVAAAYDLKHLEGFLKNNQIKQIRFLVDYSFPNRQPEFFQKLFDFFGLDCIRVARVHSKFAVITSDDWNIAIRTSMNLNENRRIENFEISDSPELAKYLTTVLNGFFAKPYEGRVTRPGTRDSLQNSDLDKFKTDEDLDTLLIDAGL